MTYRLATKPIRGHMTIHVALGLGQLTREEGGELPQFDLDKPRVVSIFF